VNPRNPCRKNHCVLEMWACRLDVYVSFPRTPQMLSQAFAGTEPGAEHDNERVGIMEVREEDSCIAILLMVHSHLMLTHC
jgi:hypothetical protein